MALLAFCDGNVGFFTLKLLAFLPLLMMYKRDKMGGNCVSEQPGSRRKEVGSNRR